MPQNGGETLELPKMRNHELEWKRLSVFWPRVPEAGLPGGDTNLWLLAQDAGLRVWSYLRGIDGQSQETDKRRLYLEGCTPDLVTVLTGCFPDRSSWSGLTENIASFAQVVAQTIVLTGSVDYEIAQGWLTTDEKRSLKEAALSYIPSGSLCRVGPLLVQLVPKNHSVEKARAVRIPLHHVARFRAPREWRTPLSRVRAQLPVIGRAEGRWQDDILNQRGVGTFEEVRRQHELAIARCTSAMGWDARNLLGRQLSDYHMMVRFMRWSRFCIHLRDEILREIDRTFRRIGKHCGESPRLRWAGLLGVDDIADAERALKEGAAAFPEILRELDRQ